jgi:hypothetical protein
MGFRRSPEAVAAARTWKEFVSRNAALVDATGLPPAALATVVDWDDFLTHGYVVGDPARFAVEQLSPAQYDALVQLAAHYFGAGYEYYTPIALRPDDQAALRDRFER